MPYTFHEFPHTRNYDSDLREMIQIVRDIEDYLANLDSTIDELRAAITDIDSMKNAISLLQENVSVMEQWINTLDYKIDLTYEYTDSQISLLRIQMETTRLNLQRQITDLMNIIEQINSDSLNPWHYELGVVHLQKNIELSYCDLADKVPLARDYSELGLTADEYASLGLPAYEYAVRGCEHLHLDWVYSPVYGWKQEISNVLTSIVNAAFGTLSASDYSALDMTADEYASMDMTSEDYQRYNPTATTGYLRVSPSGNGLTKSQFEHIELV